ncbi:uncharacterized protein LOC125608631 [Brassica napus]|uniref:uncharacterized protein LOC125608631 n=1 Tax=Brassica napus TaxID=3708 RepID=UPI002078EBFD|nr:uncharacterized protein LOC125608631 [Brassica napus]
MVFVEGTKESIQGALAVFDIFAEWSGLMISIAKSTLYLAGVSETETNNILSNFPFAKGDLPVRYLGLPLMTKVMRKQDYFPLVEKIRGRISTWTTRFLSFGGRLQLIKAVIMSVVNFWSTVYLLPSKCIKEIEHLCEAFLWTGPELKATGAKVAWSVICQTNKEGGLGIRDLKVVNRVNVLKLIWRLFSSKSLWGRWIEVNLLKKKCFWEIKEKTQMGSWMWRKMLKTRDIARRFHKRELGNGVLVSLLGERGIVSLGIRREATLEEAVMCVRRRRSHRSQLLNEVETQLVLAKEKLRDGVEDGNIWKRRSGYKKEFSTHETWSQMRTLGESCSWSKAVWFSQATPKYAFMTWLAVRDKLSTMDRVSKWRQGADEIWECQTSGILLSAQTNVWSEVLAIIMDESLEKKKRFCLRYAFQATIHAVWIERNKIKHEVKPLLIATVMKLVEKGIRNKLSILRSRGVKGWEDGLQYWFTRT